MNTPHEQYNQSAGFQTGSHSFVPSPTPEKSVQKQEHSMQGAIRKSWSEYPLGTRAHAISGGHWVKVGHGWKWHVGDVFPTPGANVSWVEEPASEAPAGETPKDEDLELLRRLERIRSAGEPLVPFWRELVALRLTLQQRDAEVADLRQWYDKCHANAAEVLTLRTEVKELKNTLIEHAKGNVQFHAIVGPHPAEVELATIKGQLSTTLREKEALEADKARLDWFEANGARIEALHKGPPWKWYVFLSRKNKELSLNTIRSAIDAARSAPKTGEQA